jgi:hypothetical protein
MQDLIKSLQNSFGGDTRVSVPADSIPAITPGNNEIQSSNTSVFSNDLDAWDLKRRSAFPAVTGGLTNRSLTSFNFYLDPSIILAALMIDQSTLRWDLSPLRCIFGADGLTDAPTVGAGNVSVNVAYTPIIGWVVVARAVDTQSGQANFKVTTSSNGFSGSWSLEDVSKVGVAFFWQSSRSNSRVLTWTPNTGDATVPATADATDLIFDPLTSSPFLVEGTNVALDIFPVLLTDSVKKALLTYIAQDKLNEFSIAVARGFAGA